MEPLPSVLAANLPVPGTSHRADGGDGLSSWTVRGLAGADPGGAAVPPRACARDVPVGSFHSRLTIGSPQVFALVQQADTKQESGDLRGAFRDFREAARLEPRSRDIWVRYEEAYNSLMQQEQEELLASPAGPDGLGSQVPGSSSLAPAVAQVSTARRRTDWNTLGNSPGPGRTSIGGNVMTVGGRVSVVDADNEGGLIELGFGSNRTYMGIHVAWMLTIILAIVHYAEDKRAGLKEGSLTILIFLSAVWSLWRCSRHNRQVSVSLSDTTKVVCAFAISTCSLVHWWLVFDEDKKAQ